MKAPPWMNKDEANAWQIGFEMGREHLPDQPQEAPVPTTTTTTEDDICQCVTCGRMHRRLGKPPVSVMEQIARDIREGTFPKKSEQTKLEEREP